MTNDAELLRLLDELDAHRRSQIAALRAPTLPTRLLVDGLGIPRTTLQNWHARHLFRLDADTSRQGDAHRLFSARDAILLAAAAQVAAIGAPLTVTERAAHMVCDAVVSMIGRSLTPALRPQLVAFCRGGEWWLVPRALSGPPRVVQGHVYRAGDWSTEDIDDTLFVSPPLYIVFDIFRFAQDVLAKLGLTMTYGTAAEHRRVADELDDGEDRK